MQYFSNSLVAYSLAIFALTEPTFFKTLRSSNSKNLSRRAGAGNSNANPEVVEAEKAKLQN